MTIFVLFFVELMVMRYAKFGHGHDHDDEHEHDSHSHGKFESEDSLGIKPEASNSKHDHKHGHKHDREDKLAAQPDYEMQSPPSAAGPHAPGENHLGHAGKHVDNEDVDSDWAEHQGHKHSVMSPESYSAQLTAIFILEFGVIFHSIFVGLTLAVSSRSEFPTLYVVLVFHQTFEGLGLGSRLASIPWPKSKKWTPYMLAMGYAISTPIAIAIGLGINNTFAPGSATTLIVNGVFDSISAGILIYTGLVELMAHEFMFSNYMQKASIKTVLAAFFTMCLGAGLMALLGKWA